jgi:hypothetical protein
MKADEDYRAKFERLGAAGEAYFQELRGQNAALVAEKEQLRNALILALDTADHDPICLYNDDEGPCTCWRAAAHKALGHIAGPHGY